MDPFGPDRLHDRGRTRAMAQVSCLGANQVAYAAQAIRADCPGVYHDPERLSFVPLSALKKCPGPGRRQPGHSASLTAQKAMFVSAGAMPSLIIRSCPVARHKKQRAQRHDFFTKALRSASQTISSRWLKARWRKVTMPALGRDRIRALPQFRFRPRSGRR